MARDFLLRGGGHGGGGGGQVVGLLVFICMVIVSLSVLSMIVMACADSPTEEKRKQVGGRFRGGGCGGGCGGCGGCGG